MKVTVPRKRISAVVVRLAVVGALTLGIGASPAAPQSTPGTYEGVCIKGAWNVSYPTAEVCAATYSCFLGFGCSDICYAATWINAHCGPGSSTCTLIRKKVGNQVCIECDCPDVGLYSCVGGSVFDDGDNGGLICQ